MRYLPKSPAEREKLLAEIGAASIDDLFSIIPAEYRLSRDLLVPRQQAESEIIDYFQVAGDRNARKIVRLDTTKDVGEARTFIGLTFSLHR